MAEFYEKFFILTPTPTTETAINSLGNVFPVYLNAQGDKLKWSGKFPIPAIGSRIFITMNGIGWAVVKGYFESCGYVGVMTLATRPPKWLRDQDSKRHPDWVLEGIGCEFGSEIALKRPKPAKVEVAV